MKKFVYGAVVTALILLGLYYAVYYAGFYLNFDSGAPIQVSVRTDGGAILVKDEEGTWVPFIVKGVDLASSTAGHLPSDYAVDEQTWLRWFGQIQNMGANTIRIYTIYNDTFYNALYRFNNENAEPLYLLQGLQVTDYANHSSQDAYGAEFYAALRKDSLDVIDVLHGRKNIALNRMKGSGNYRKDVSKWVLGYIIGNEWDAGTIAYTNHNSSYQDVYEGEYFRTGENATVFEAMIAKIMDAMISYESAKYKTQKLVSFQNDPENDPFVYEEQYARQLRKFSQTDAEHILPTEKLESGYFASYRLYEFCSEFAHCFSREQKAGLDTILKELDTSLFYQGYTQLLSEYHSMPVVITGYGFSSSRGTDRQEGPFTEGEQGRRLVQAYDDIVSSGCSGACITSWQDVWGRRSWNTSFAVDVKTAGRWHDIQTDGQCYGLLSFDPGETKSVCCVDGDGEEWTDEDQILENAAASLSAKYDERCLYLYVEQKGLTEETKLYLPIDVTPKSGSKTDGSRGLAFERAADFVLCLEGKFSSRLFVQARYEAVRENYLMQISGEDPFVTFPEKDSSSFVPIRMILQNHKLVSQEDTEEAILAAKRYDTIETGRMRYGNADPESSEYDSLSDFCYGADCVEIRIPWQLLNFADPSQMEIQDDYYENYGVEFLRIQEIYIGIGTENTEIPMAKFSLTGWGEKPSYHERLKRSYEVVRESWGGTNAS